MCSTIMFDTHPHFSMFRFVSFGSVRSSISQIFSSFSRVLYVGMYFAIVFIFHCHSIFFCLLLVEQLSILSLWVYPVPHFTLISCGVAFFWCFCVCVWHCMCDLVYIVWAFHCIFYMASMYFCRFMFEFHRNKGVEDPSKKFQFSLFICGWR